MEDQEPLTEIEQSRADTGFRYYVVQPEVYTGLTNAVDADRGYPNKQGTTLRGLLPTTTRFSTELRVSKSLLN